MSKSNSDVMQPEKIRVIYQQFPWLKEVSHPGLIRRAFVRRVTEETLDYQTSTYSEFVPYGVWETPEVSIWLVDGKGNLTCLGEETKSERLFFFWKIQRLEYHNETVRQGITKLPWNPALYVVILERDPKRGNTLVVFKPPQNGVTLQEWYEKRSKEVVGETLAEIQKA